MWILQQIISGGQTGVDRGALDAAMALGIPHGGWCPAGRLAEDGCIPAQYQLTEIDAPDYALRTEKNVLEANGTLILCRGPLSGGTELTHHLCRLRAKPCLVIDLKEPAGGEEILEWIRRHAIRRLNVAGPRESSHPGIQAETESYLRKVFAAR